MCTVEFFKSRNWYSRNSDTPAVVENSPKSRIFHKSDPSSTVVLSPDLLSPTASTMKIPDPQSPGHSASQEETEEISENIEERLDASEPAVEHNNQME